MQVQTGTENKSDANIRGQLGHTRSERAKVLVGKTNQQGRSQVSNQESEFKVRPQDQLSTRKEVLGKDPSKQLSRKQKFISNKETDKQATPSAENFFIMLLTTARTYVRSWPLFACEQGKPGRKPISIRVFQSETFRFGSCQTGDTSYQMELGSLAAHDGTADEGQERHFKSLHQPLLFNFTYVRYLGA